MKKTTVNRKMGTLGFRKQKNGIIDSRASLSLKKARAAFSNHRIVIVICLSA